MKKNILLLFITLFYFVLSFSCKNDLSGFLLEPNTLPFTNGGIMPESNRPTYTAIYAPKQLTATMGLIDKIEINWLQESTVDFYNVYRSEIIDGSYLFLGKIDKTNNETGKEFFTNSPIAKSISYYYKVTSVNSNSIESGYSQTVEGFAYSSTATDILPPVSIVVSQGEYSNKIEVQWNEVPGATKYILYWSNTGIYDETVGEKEFSEHWTEISETEIASPNQDNITEKIFAKYIHDNLDNTKPYFYCIQSVKNEMKSMHSDIKQGFFLNESIPFPTNFKATRDQNNPNAPSDPPLSSTATQTEITLTWDPVMDYNYYAIYRSDSIDMNGKPIFNQIAVVNTSLPTDSIYVDTSEFAVDEKDHQYSIKTLEVVVTESGNPHVNSYGQFYDGEVFGSVIKKAPVITIPSDNPYIFDLTQNPTGIFTLSEVVANDNLDNDITGSLIETISQDFLDTNPNFLMDRKVSIGDSFTITYTVKDRAGYKAESKVLNIEVSALIDPTSPITLSLMTDDPTFILKDDILTLSFTRNEDIKVYELTPIIDKKFIIFNSEGVEITRISCNSNIGGTEGTLDLSTITDSAYTGERFTFKLWVKTSVHESILDESYSFVAYPPVPDCPIVPNGTFEDTTNVAPWKWDIDTRWETFADSNWKTDAVQDSSINHKERREQVTDLKILGKDGVGKVAIICDTTEDTRGFEGWNYIPDIQQTAGKLYSPSIPVKNLPTGLLYKLTADIFRGTNCSTDIKMIATFPTGKKLEILIPATQDQWHTVEIKFNPDIDGDLVIEFFKGKSFTDSDMGEVRFDNVTLSYDRTL